MVVVSASLDVYLEPWCKSMGVDVICTQVEARSGHLTGKYVDGDCCGEAKATRIRRRYALSDYATVYAYGDTEEDRHMLEMADRKFFRWQEVLCHRTAGPFDGARAAFDTPPRLSRSLLREIAIVGGGGSLLGVVGTVAVRGVLVSTVGDVVLPSTSQVVLGVLAAAALAGTATLIRRWRALRLDIAATLRSE